MIDQRILYTGVALYLSDGTTARKSLDIPLEQDDAGFVMQLITNHKRTGTPIQVDSMDIKSSSTDLFVMPEHIVAFVINP